MIRLWALVLSVTVILTGMLNAQNNKAEAGAEPQYINSFYALGAEGKLIELDHQQVTAIHVKTKPLPGYATVKVLVEFKPAHASVRLSGDAQFVVKGRAPLDPSSRFELRLLKVSKDRREFLMTQAHGTIVGATATTSLDEGAVPIRFEDYGADSYRIVPQQTLSPGEYALGLRGVVTELYCFGVDR